MGRFQHSVTVTPTGLADSLDVGVRKSRVQVTLRLLAGTEGPVLC